MTARSIMVQGTMSGAGKSLLTAALCRIFRQDGYRVAPFKSQNMALNSYITRDGLEMGRAQVMQAEACGIEPDARMNPVLLKPSSDTGSQVIVLGEIRGQMSAADYYNYKTSLMPEIMKAYDSLAEDYDIIVLEGAGSPAEINLKENDIVNMGMAKAASAPVLLAGDIDRGGVFAQLYGTVKLLDQEEQDQILGLIVNKFRGDPDILAPGIAMLEERVGKPVLGVVPMVHVDIDDEDSLAPRLQGNPEDAVSPLDVCVIRLPRISNFTDFAPLEAHPMIKLRYVSRPDKLGDPDLVILPGTKSTTADLLWLRSSGLEARLLQLASGGRMVIGICGGYQMLGEELLDPDHNEGEADSLRGLGLLPVTTHFEAEKTRTRVQARVTTEMAGGAFRGLSLDAYEIHMGRSDVRGEAFASLGEEGRQEGCCFGNVFGTYLHGLFDTGELTEALVKELCRQKGIPYEASQIVDRRTYADKQYDILADAVRKALDMKAIYQAMGLPGPRRSKQEE